MLMLFWLLLMLSSASATAQVRDVHYRGNLTPLNTVPTFGHGYLVVYDRDHRIDVFAADGTLVYAVAARMPGADWADVENGAIDSDGTLALAVRGVSASGRAKGGGIALFDRIGSQIQFFDTGEYLPTQVAFGPDHSIWTIGWLGGETMASLDADYAILRNYAQDGRQLGSFLRQTLFPLPQNREPLIMPMLGLWELRVADKRVDAILSRAHLWVETDLNGQEKGRWDTGPNVDRPLAVTQDGKTWRKDGHQLKIFDRSIGVWRAVPFDTPEGFLVGGEGNNLVFLLPGQNTLRWVPAPSEFSAP